MMIRQKAAGPRRPQNEKERSWKGEKTRVAGTAWPSERGSESNSLLEAATNAAEVRWWVQ